MKFKVVEKQQKMPIPKFWRSFGVKLFQLITFILLLPFLLVNGIWSLVFGESKRVKMEPWVELFSNRNLRLERKFIAKENYPANLDYGTVVQDVYLFEMLASPEIVGVNNNYFDAQLLEKPNGFYVLRYNNNPNGMDLLFIHKQKVGAYHIRNLPIALWRFIGSDNIILEAEINGIKTTIEVQATN